MKIRYILLICIQTLISYIFHFKFPASILYSTDLFQYFLYMIEEPAYIGTLSLNIFLSLLFYIVYILLTVSIIEIIISHKMGLKQIKKRFAASIFRVLSVQLIGILLSLAIQFLPLLIQRPLESLPVSSTIVNILNVIVNSLVLYFSIKVIFNMPCKNQIHPISSKKTRLTFRVLISGMHSIIIFLYVYIELISWKSYWEFHNNGLSELIDRNFLFLEIATIIFYIVINILYLSKYTCIHYQSHKN